MANVLTTGALFFCPDQKALIFHTIVALTSNPVSDGLIALSRRILPPTAAKGPTMPSVKTSRLLVKAGR